MHPQTSSTRAFEQNDKAAIKALMTPDHISVTPYYDGPQTTDDQIASLPESMRGFGHVKEKNVKAAKEREASLLAAYRDPARQSLAAE